jgi:hypothetical protein
MSVINATPLLAAAGGDYQISRSVRLRSSASAYLSRTFSTGDRKKWTWSGWVKRGAPLGQALFVSSDGASYTSWLVFNSPYDTGEGKLSFSDYSTGAVCSALLRDYSAWYHIIVVYDTAQATASNRVKYYINGVQITATGTFPALSADGYINYAGPHRIGKHPLGWYFDGYLAEVNFIDGQALTPSSFGETDAVTGVWKPKKYAGTYGTNGFYLNFSDPSSTTTIGYDYSGNGNNWTSNNISVTSGVTYDSMIDVPTLYADGGNGRGNYATLNPLDKANSPTASNANLTISGASATSNMFGCTIGVSSGKWYWETYQNATFSSSSGTYNGNMGVYQSGTALGIGATATSWGYGNYNGIKYSNNVATAYGSGTTTGDIVMCALDMDSGKIWWGKNGTWFASGDPAAGTNAAFTNLSGTVIPSFRLYSEVGARDMSVNFGQRPFAYTPPTGFKALNTQNLPAGSITTSGSFTGNASADGPSVYLNGVPTAMTINGNAVTFATHVDKTAYGFKLRTSSSSYNASGSNSYSITTTGAKFKYANAQVNP